MKVLMITLRADHGGGPQHIDQLVNNLPYEFEIFIACPNDDPYYSMWAANSKIRDICELPHRKFDLKKLYALHQFVKSNKIHIIHSHGKGAGIYSRLLKILNSKLKIIHTLHGFHIQEYSSFSRKIYIKLEFFLTQFTDKFINVSNGEKEICLNTKVFSDAQSRVIYNGIEQITKIDNAKSLLDLENKIVITTISRFDYPKNMFFGYEIAKQFKDYDNIVFLWLGDGLDKTILEQKAKEENVNIIFTGFIKEIGLYLSGTDIYLSTSRWEGLPYALIEAQSLGIPIIATNVVGNNEIVEDNITGFLFDTKEQAFHKIMLLIQETEKYQQFSNNAKDHFYLKFKKTTMIEKIVDEYLLVGSKE